MEEAEEWGRTSPGGGAHNRRFTPPPEWGIEEAHGVRDGRHTGGGGGGSGGRGGKGGEAKGGAATRTSMLREKSAAAAREKAAEARRIHMMAQRIVLENHERGAGGKGQHGGKKSPGDRYGGP